MVVVDAGSGAEGSWDVQVVGHLCLDLLPRLPGAADTTPGRLVDVGPMGVRLGGCVGNTGLDVAALGLRTLVVSTVGDDALAALTAELLDAAPGVEHRLAAVAGASTSYSVVVEPPGEDRTFWHHTGSNAVFGAPATGVAATGRRGGRPAGGPVDPGAAPLMHLGYLPLLPALTAAGGAALLALLGAARAAGTTTSVDLCVVDPRADPRDWAGLLAVALPLVDLVSPSLDDLRSALGAPELRAAEAAEHLVRAGAAVAVVSDGARGVEVRTAPAGRFSGGLLAALPADWHGRCLQRPPVPGPVVSTTGAGDATSAGLLAGVHRGLGLDATLDLALCAAAHRVAGLGSLTRLGATPAGAGS